MFPSGEKQAVNSLYRCALLRGMTIDTQLQKPEIYDHEKNRPEFDGLKTTLSRTNDSSLSAAALPILRDRRSVGKALVADLAMQGRTICYHQIHSLSKH